MSNKNIEVLMKNVVASDELKEKLRQQTIEKGNVLKYRKTSFKKVVLVACMCVVMLTMTIVTVANVDKIEDYFAKILGFDEKEYQDLVEDGFVQYHDIVSETKQGVTITIKETIADKSKLMILYCVKYEDGGKSDDEVYYFDEIKIDGIMPSGTRKTYIGGGNEAEGEYWYAINIDCEDNVIIDGQSIELTFANLMSCSTKFDKKQLYKIGDDGIVTIDGEDFAFYKLDANDEELGELIAEPGTLTFMYDEQGRQYVLRPVTEEQNQCPAGNVNLIITESGEKYVKVEDKTEEIVVEDIWSVQLNVKANESITYIPVNDTVDANGYRYFMDKVCITPFSLQVIFSETAEIIDEQYVLDNMNMDTYTEMMKKYEDIKKENKELYYSVFDYEYFPLDIRLVMKDGTEYKMSDMKYAIGNGGEWYRMNERIEMENVEMVIIEGKEYLLTE